MNITLFANSTIYTPMPDEFTTLGEGSCLDLLQEEYKDRLNGMWLNGLTALTVKNIVSEFMRNRHPNNWVVLLLGSVECYSHPSKNFLEWAVHYLNYYGPDPDYMSIVAPKMLEAARDLNGANDKFFRLLSPVEFRHLMSMILTSLEGFSTLLIGINRPHEGRYWEGTHWHSQAMEYNEILRGLKDTYPVKYINCWDEFAPYVVDTTHMTLEGHNRLYAKIKEIING